MKCKTVMECFLKKKTLVFTRDPQRADGKKRCLHQSDLFKSSFSDRKKNAQNRSQMQVTPIDDINSIFQFISQLTQAHFLVQYCVMINETQNGSQL